MDQVRNITWEEYGTTVITPVAILFLVLMIFLVMTIEKRNLAIPLIITACFIPFKQRIVIADIDFTLVRILIICSWIRIFLKKEHKMINFNRIDFTLIFYVLVSIITHTLLWKTSNALIYKAGIALDTLGAYFVFRIAIFNVDVVKRIIKTLALVSILVAAFMVIEQINGRNFFSIFGGVPEITPVREGKLRSQGAFSHSILAGTFGALLLPLMWGIYNRKKRETKIPLVGVIVGVVITLTSSSSTPMISVFASIIAIFLWSVRRRMNRVYIIVFFLLLGLQMMMSHPIWFLLQKIDLVGGSTGYHRYLLIDQAVRRIGSWWLLGIKTTAYWGWGLQDVTNQYILEGVEGGLASLMLFAAVMLFSFKKIRFFLYKLENQREQVYNLRIVWALGATLFSHAVVFIGVSYFGQMMLFYYLLIAIISSMDFDFFRQEKCCIGD